MNKGGGLLRGGGVLRAGERVDRDERVERDDVLSSSRSTTLATLLTPSWLLTAFLNMAGLEKSVFCGFASRW
jgi:hypothetical protein